MIASGMITFLLTNVKVLLFCVKKQILKPNKYLNQMDITIKQAQQQVDEWIQTVGVRYFNELTNLGILMEEVGEMSRIMVRRYGEQSFKETDKHKNLSDEMADVLWVLICLANQTGVDLTDALQKNFEKKNIRDSNRHKDNEKLK
jgi:NTP pyrophosphatase (non-canonical NTP hydrolase)